MINEIKISADYELNVQDINSDMGMFVAEEWQGAFTSLKYPALDKHTGSNNNDIITETFDFQLLKNLHPLAQEYI